MLGRLRDAASLAIQVTTGRKLNLDKPNTSSNIITGFGYSMLDIFENQFVDMDTIITNKESKVEEHKSPFASPKKRRLNGSITKDDYKQKRKEEKRQQMEDYERREREPPKQYSLMKIKTSVGRYPVINYVSQFTAEEIHEAKRCLLNLLKRAQGAISPHSPFASPDKKKGRAGRFALNVQAAYGDSEQVLKEEQAQHSEEEKKEGGLEPKSRAPGGVWVRASDIPHSFQNFIVYHNLSKMSHSTIH